MTLINIDLRNVAGETGRHDQVVFHAPVHREGSAGQTIQTAPVIVDLEGGIGSVDLDPGPVVVEIRARGWEDTAPKTVMVPEEGPITLTGLLLDAFEWAPVVVSEVRALAQRVETVANTFGSLEGVAVSVQAAQDAAESAEDDRVVVEQAATSASWSGDRLTVLGATSPPLTGEPGPAGATPYVGANGNWWVGDTDTGVQAQGEKGDPGDGAGDVLWSELTPVLDGKAAVSHDHTIGQVAGLQGELDGKADADHQHAWGDVTGKPSTYPPESHAHPSTDISDATATGRSVLTASSAAAARSAIGAGTSSLALGTTSSTAAAGNHTHSQYATTTTVNSVSGRVTTLENAQPIIVSSLPSSPLPGRIYLVTG